jgi:hypothetical protein
MRLADTSRDRADVHIAEIDVPAVFTFGISSAGEFGHVGIKAPPCGGAQADRLLENDFAIVIREFLLEPE